MESMRLRAENAHQIVLQAQEEFRRAGIALASRTAAQLIVDAPALVALGAENEEAARVDDALLVFGDFGADLGRCDALVSSSSVMSASSSRMRMSGLPPS